MTNRWRSEKSIVQIHLNRVPKVARALKTSQNKEGQRKHKPKRQGTRHKGRHQIWQASIERADAKFGRSVGKWPRG